MSILINGMKMPQSCSNCNWSRYSFPNAWCSMTHHKVDIEVAKNGRPDGCPLIEVQEPHGRLGDLTAIEAQLDYIANLDWNKQVGGSGGMLAALEVVEDAPTIIPASEEGE